MKTEQTQTFDVIIIGGGITGWMMNKRLKMDHPNFKVAIVDKQKEKIHPFHLHRLIPDIPELSNLKSAELKTNVWDGSKMKEHPTIDDINKYSFKVFSNLQINNLYTQGTIKIYPMSKQKLLQLIKGNTSKLPTTFFSFYGDVGKILVDRKQLLVEDGTNEYDLRYRYLINTSPLPNLLELCDIKHSIKFENFPFYTAVIEMERTNMYQMIYDVSEDSAITRVTLLDDKLFIEARDIKLSEDDVSLLYNVYGIFSNDLPDLKLLTPGRFRPIPNEQRKPLFHYLTEKYNIFTLGRWGAWTYKVVNNIWEDTKFISDLIYVKEQVCKFEGGLHGCI